VNYEITIFNRWGEMIFQSTNPNEGWDGTFRGKKMPASLYPYVIVYENLENPGEKVSLTGTVALIR
jgi:gliding motility-associated-like protein